jgi:hypothetical protein
MSFTAVAGIQNPHQQAIGVKNTAKLVRQGSKTAKNVFRMATPSTVNNTAREGFTLESPKLMAQKLQSINLKQNTNNH